MTKQFKTGRTYQCRSVCDYDCVFSFEVVKRTAKSVWIKSHGRDVVRRMIQLHGCEEFIFPHGRYSMAAVLRATD